MPSGVYKHRRKAIKERFFAIYNRMNKPKKECWIWPGVKDNHGYGRMFLENINGHTKIALAHRLSYEYLIAPISIKIEICHHCDNSSCIRPSHLFPGTHFQNMRDGVAKNSFSNNGQNSPKGEHHPNHKLSEESVHKILDLYASGNISMIALTKRFHVSIGLVYGIIRGMKWKHVVKSNKEMLAQSQRICRKLTDAQFADIEIRYSQGERPTDLARIYGITASRIIEIGKHGY